MLKKFTIILLVLVISDFLFVVSGISNNENVIDKEYHRAAEQPESLDQTDADSTKRDLPYYDQYKYQQLGYGYPPIGPDNLGYIPSGNTLRHYNAYGYPGELSGYGSVYPGVNGGYGHSGAGLGHYGHDGIAGGYAPYGHSGGGVHYGHHGGDYEHEEGYGPSAIGHYLQKKLTLKKLILPLAGIALLAAAAGALTTSNPLLLQLGTIGGTARGKRSLSRLRNVFPENPFVKPDRNK